MPPAPGKGDNARRQSVARMSQRCQSPCRWTVGFRMGRGNQFAYCEVILTPPAGRTAAARRTASHARNLSVATSGVSGATDPVGLFVIGVAPAGTAPLRVEFADARRCTRIVGLGVEQSDDLGCPCVSRARGEPGVTIAIGCFHL